MHDIENRKDIDNLLRIFYEKLLVDDVIGFLFTEVAEINLERHLPILGDFWETLLFASGDYARHRRNPLQVHLNLHAKSPLRPEHFARWLELFDASVDDLFSGPRALFTKQRARGIAARFMSAMPDSSSDLGTLHEH